MYYFDTGSGEVIVLLHGFCGSSEYWSSVIPTLSKHYRVIAPDLRGHGKSTAPNEHDQIEDYAEDVLHLINQLKVDKVTLLGHSMGGYIALAFAEKYSDRLHAFGLIHSTALPDSEQAKTGREKNQQIIRQQGMEYFIKQLVPKLFAPDHVVNMKEKIRKVEEIGFQTSAKGAIAALRAMKDRPDRTHILEQSNLPILLVAGENDMLIPVKNTFTIKNENITEGLIDGAGHMSMIEVPEDLYNYIQKFMHKLI